MISATWTADNQRSHYHASMCAGSYAPVVKGIALASGIGAALNTGREFDPHGPPSG